MTRKILSALLIAMLAQTAATQAQQRPDQTAIRLRGITIQPTLNASQWADSANAAIPAGAVKQVIIQFSTIPTETEKTQLRNMGITLADYIPDNSFVATVRFPLNKSLMANMRSIVALKPDFKIDRRVGQQQGAERTVFVTFQAGISKVDIAAIINAHQGKIKDRRFEAQGGYEITIPAAELLPLAGRLEVKYIGTPARDKALNYEERNATGAMHLQAPLTAGGYALEGNGVTIGVGDNSSGLYHTDTRDRVTNFNSDPPADHGSHTSGTAAGAGILDNKARGMAPKANILGHLYNLVWAQTGSMHQTYNMTLTNNSYAAVVGDCDFAGTYDQFAEMLDQQAAEYPDVLHVFAAGNDGNKQCLSFPQGYATISGGYQPAKNIIVVGSIKKDLSEHTGSSKGPVKDGRLKPEMVIFGHRVYSDYRFDTYSPLDGTSMAAPAATGALALLTERYKQLHGNANPPGNVLKALLVNGATDVGNPGPDYKYGFGVLNADHAINMLNAGQYIEDNIAQGGTNTHSITIPANTAAVKLMLYWHDPAASPLAAAALVNNLNLKVTEPNSTQHLPLILNSTPANVSDVAAEGVDNLNNAEQVTINNPTAGTYTVTVSGALIPAGSQEYVVAYDFIPVGVRLIDPVQGQAMIAGDSVNLYWEAPVGSNGFTLEFSTNGGGAWTTIDGNIPAASRMRRWDIPAGISSAQCLVRLSTNGGGPAHTSGTFTISPIPTIQLSGTQCPGYIAIEWAAIPGASGYELMRKMGTDMQPVDTVAGTNYTFSGLWPDSNYYVAMRPLINGKPGFRSVAITRKPNDGSCTGPISDNDLMLNAIVLNSGRKLTSTALGNAQPFSINVRNLDDAASGSFNIHYQVNGGSWAIQSAGPAPAGAVISVPVGPVNFSAPGTYTIRAAVQNSSSPDPVHANDTLVKTIHHLSNDPVDINATFADGFESGSTVSLHQDEMGISSNGHWDFENSNDSGRLRNVVGTDITIAGNRSVSMDALYNLPAVQNYLAGTFNLAAYDTASTEARVEFDYRLHGKLDNANGNEVWVRGSDAQPWISIYRADTAAVPGVIINTGSLSITHALHQAGQQFTSSFGVRIGQRDTSCIAAVDYGNGLTLDNFRLYSVKNDVQLLAISSPQKANCALLATEPLVVSIYNSDNLPQQNVQLFYKLDNGSVVQNTLSSIAPKDTVLFTFSQVMDLSAVGLHIVDVWLVAAGDTYLPNDTITAYPLRNKRLVTEYPCLERFEADNGTWYTEGIKTSWEYGTPVSQKIDKAASGTKAWKTNLSGAYNDNENSYLVSPCYDISQLANPMLSFSSAMDIENCGETICDAAWVEWSNDGISWATLGSAGQGRNWYAGQNFWNAQDDTRWKVTSISLPQSSQPISIRFVFHSDAGAGREGVAIDDIHIFDLQNPVFIGTNATGTVGGGAGWTDAVAHSEVFASVNASPGSIDISAYSRNSLVHPLSKLYLLSRNFVVGVAAADSLHSRFYITDNDVLQLLQDNSCGDCPKPADAYRLGVLQYRDADVANVNGSLLDNRLGGYSFKPFSDLLWVPYEKGYYVETSVSPSSEIWLSTGKPDMEFSGVNIYPNPVTNSEISIVWTAMPGTSMNLVLTDAAGRTVYKNAIVADGWDNRSNIRFSQLASGVYLLKYEIGGKRKEMKLVAY
jgi:hypothetical protein